MDATLVTDMKDMTDSASIDAIAQALGDRQDLLQYQSRVARTGLHLPGPDFVERVFAASDRSPQVLRNLQQIFQTGRLGGTGYLSILPVDQGVEHAAGASFAPNPLYFDPANIVRLAIEGGCNAVASTRWTRASACSMPSRTSTCART